MSTNSSTPIAQYTERLPQVRREIRLYADRVDIDAAWTVGKDYHTSVRLVDLLPQTKRFFVRNRWFKKAIVVGSLAIAVAVVFNRIPGDYPAWLARSAMIGWPVAAGCAVLAFWSFPKREFVRFSNRDGKAALDICRAGPDRARFDEFVAQIQKAIKKA